MSTVPKTGKDEWSCPHCTTVNSNNHLNCQSCLKYRPGQKPDLRAEQEHLPSSGVVKRSWTDRLREWFSAKPLEWTCPNCTCINGGYYTICNVCSFRRQKEQPKKKKTDGSWSISSWFRKEKGGDGGAKWSCEYCTLENPEREKKCSACQQPRPPSRDANESPDRRQVPEPRPSDEGLSSPVDPQDSDPGLGRSSSVDRVTPPSGTDDSSRASGSRDYPTGHRLYRPPPPHHRGDQFHSIPALQESTRDPLEFSSMVSDGEGGTWQCTTCGTINPMRMAKCHYCGFGTNPEQFRRYPVQPTPHPPPAIASPGPGNYVIHCPGGEVLLVPDSALRYYRPRWEPPQYQYQHPHQEWERYPRPYPHQGQYGYPVQPPYHDPREHRLPHPNFQPPQYQQEHQYRDQHLHQQPGSQHHHQNRGRERQSDGARRNVPVPAQVPVPVPVQVPVSVPVPVPARRLERKLSDCGPSSMEESVRGNRTKLILEQKQQDEVEASRTFRNIQEYCRQVCAQDDVIAIPVA